MKIKFEVENIERYYYDGIKAYLVFARYKKYSIKFVIYRLPLSEKKAVKSIKMLEKLDKELKILKSDLPLTFPDAFEVLKARNLVKI